MHNKIPNRGKPMSHATVILQDVRDNMFKHNYENLNFQQSITKAIRHLDIEFILWCMFFCMTRVLWWLW